jgi:hypothetical protein
MSTVTDDRRETASLIGSDKVEGTAVYGADNQKIGSIQRVMIDKISGKVAYAVTSFGGFLGIGEDYYPLPWPTLKYDTALGGYRTGLTADRLRGAPKYTRTSDWDWNDRALDRTTTIRHHSGIEASSLRDHLPRAESRNAGTLLTLAGWCNVPGKGAK